MRTNLKKYGVWIGLAGLCAVLLTMQFSGDDARWNTKYRVEPANAQTPAGYGKTGTAFYRGATVASASTVPTLFCQVYSDTAGVIRDGCVVQVDTSTTSPTRITVKPWANTALSRPLILGLAYGDIPSSATGAAGRVLIMGFHGNAKMPAGLSANASIKTNLSESGTVTTVADSLTGACGWFIGYNPTTGGGVSHGKVIITRPMGFFFGSL